jgi:hypothetical protein
MAYGGGGGGGLTSYCEVHCVCTRSALANVGADKVLLPAVLPALPFLLQSAEAWNGTSSAY